MSIYLGIDTSNYTTSAAFYRVEDNKAIGCKKLLPVSNSSLGLRQSDAVFAHVKQLGDIIDQLLKDVSHPTKGIGVSVRPRDAEDSYMPCFLAGLMAAKSLSAALKVPLHSFSHQAGHIMAALYSTDRLDLIGKEFIAFHFSGGTTDCLLVSPGKETPFSIKEISTSCDLKAGQAVDRVGAMLGLGFPAGAELDALSQKSNSTFNNKPVFKGLNPCLSGIENICERMLRQGYTEQDIAKCCIDFICNVVEKMTTDALNLYPELPVIYAGGVMCNTIIRESILKKFSGNFASPELSSDNACGVAILAALKEGAI